MSKHDKIFIPNSLEQHQTIYLLMRNDLPFPVIGLDEIKNAVIFTEEEHRKSIEKIDQEKRSTAIAFLNTVTEDGCSNYFRVGDEWFLGDPEEEEDAEGPFTTEQVYDQYIKSLPKIV